MKIFGHKANVCPTKKSQGAKTLKSTANNVDQSYYAMSHMVSIDSNNVCAVSAETMSKAWLLDSGCTTHLCGDEDRFQSIGKCENGRLNLASQACAEVKGRGIVTMSVASNRGPRVIEFKDTLFVPDLRTNLISVTKITNKGHEVTFRKNDAYIRDERGNMSVIAYRKGDLYYVRENVECSAVQSKGSDLFK